MVRLSAACALVAALLVPPAGAAGAWPAGSVAAAQAPGAGLAPGRLRVLELDARRARTAEARAPLEAELETLAGEIAELKRAGKPGLFGDSGLDERLRRARDLSARIDALVREETALRDALREAATAHLGAVAAEVERLRGLLAVETGPETRRAHAAALARLEAERRELRAGLGVLDDPAAPVEPPRAEAPTDDPGELRARADRLRDQRDRLARRVAELERRVRDLRDGRALEAELRGFLSETRFFDESDRRVARLTTPESGLDPEGSAEAPAPGDSQTGSLDPGSDAPPEPGRIGAEPLPEPPEGAVFRLPGRDEHRDPLLDRPDPGDGATVEQLEARAEQLRTLMGHLERRAEALEHRARRLPP